MSAAPRAASAPAAPARIDVASSVAILPPEQRLLLLTAGGAANDVAIRDAAAEPVDWARFLVLAQFERAVPVIYLRLRAVASDLVPADAFEQMRRLAQVSDFALLYLEQRLRESLRLLHRDGVEVMLLKGAALALTAYSGLRQRPMSDIDIMVQPSQATAARRLMLNNGWRDIVDGLPDDVYEHHHHLPPLYDTRSRELQLEIHTALFPERQPFAFHTSEIWAGARPLGDALPGVFVPNPVHALIHTCLHFFWSHQARFGVWRTIRDVDAIARAYGVDWDEFTATARRVRGISSCYWTLRIAQIAGRIAVPDQVLAALRPRRSAFVLRAVERHLMANLFPLPSGCPSVQLEHWLWEAAAMPRASGHGRMRPWDDDEKFLAPGASVPRPKTPGYGVRRVLALTRYLTMLVRERP